MLPDISPPAPRPLSARAVGATARSLLLFGAILTFVGGSMTVIFTVTGGAFWDDILLDRRGVTVPATTGMTEPTDFYVNDQQVHLVHYTFTDANGVARAGSGRTLDPAGFYGRSGVQIDYDPRSPGRSRLHGGAASAAGFFILLPFSALATGTIVLSIGVHRWRAMRAASQPKRSVAA